MVDATGKVGQTSDNPDPRTGAIGGVSTQFDFTNCVFPTDLGEQYHNGHWMVININESIYSNFNGVSPPDYLGLTLPNMGAVATPALDAAGAFAASKLQFLRQQIDPYVGDGNLALPGAGFTTTYTQPTKRIKQSIAMFMPSESMAFDQQTSYEGIDLTGLAASELLSLGVGNVNLEKAAQIGGRPINPRCEMFYKGTPQRQFSFNFLCAPENEKDSLALQQIIFYLRFFSAPEFGGLNTNLVAAALNILTYSAPATFDITFYQRITNPDGTMSIVENTKIPRINTCVCTNVIADYSPGASTYSCFSNGYPVQCRLTFNVTEIETLTKLRVLEGF